MASWLSEQVEQELADKGWHYKQRQIQNGMQFTLDDGTCINWYSTGKVVVAGKQTPLRQEAAIVFADQSSTTPTAPTPRVQAIDNVPTSPPRRVFIVYGHDVDAREQLELLLRRLELEPIVLQNIPSGGDTIIEKLEVFTDADFACVLLTPDDEGHPAGVFDEKKFRARQNVVLELGMVLARLGRKQVIILVKGANLERPSDTDGLIYLGFNSRVDEVKNHVAANLQKAGFKIDIAKLL